MTYIKATVKVFGDFGVAFAFVRVNSVNSVIATRGGD